jgi:hypothetical protein
MLPRFDGLFDISVPLPIVERSINGRLAYHGYHNLALPRFNVALQVKNLLPGAENRYSVGNWNRNRWPQRSRLKMRVPVAIVPGLFVPVFATWRHQAVQDHGQIPLQTRLKFNRPDRSCTANVKDVNRPDGNTAVAYNQSDGICDVLHLSMPGRVN